MKISRIILSGILSVSLFAAACGQENKTTTHKLAIYTAQADTALAAFTDAVAFLNSTSKTSNASAKSIYLINQKAVGAVDSIRDRVETGFDKKEALAIVRVLLADVRKAEADGLIGLDVETKRKFQQITFFAIFTIQSIEAVITAVKEPELTEGEKETLAAVASQTRGQETEWTQLVLILQQAALRGLNQGRMSQAAAFFDGRALSAELKASLAAKIAALESGR